MQFLFRLMGFLVLTQTLDSLDENSVETLKSKREANIFSYMDETVAGESNDQQLADPETNYEVQSSVQDVTVPMKGGSPAFSIHAQKVYILYPSMFQDPNIFGRFSIPQTINLDPLPEKTVKKNVEKTAPPVIMPPNNFYSDPYQAEQPRKLTRRQAPNPAPLTQKPSKKKEDMKHNVETHLTGTIGKVS